MRMKLERGTRCCLRWIMLGMMMGGCAAGRTDVVLLNSEVVHYPPLTTKQTVVLTMTDLESPYTELGMIHVNGVTREGYQGLNEKLRTEARRIGADAVIFVRYGTENVFSVTPLFISIPYDVLTAEGAAVRSKHD